MVRVIVDIYRISDSFTRPGTYMDTSRRISLLVSVALCGLALAAGTQQAALAERHKHHREISEQTPSLHISRHNRMLSAERTERQERRRGITHRGDIADTPPAHLIRAERLRHEHNLRLMAIEAQHQQRVEEKEHLHRLYLAENEEKQRHAERVAEYRRHLARIQTNRRQALAELNGTIASPSIRAWQAYVTSVPIRLISVDLNDPSVKVSALLSQDGIGSAEPFSRMIRRSQPDVAVTGTFFSLDNLRPVGDIVINGALAYFGGMGTALCITRDNHADMITVPWGHHHDWSQYQFVVACGPRLLDGGQIVLDPASERFHDRHMLAPNSRIGVGITAGNKLVFVMTQKPIYLGRLAKIMRAEGCKQAMNLDAGTSTGFYCDGNMMARPGRWLTNAIVVYANQHQSERASS